MKTLLFDLDGTLSESREKIGQEIPDLLESLSDEYAIGIVSGSGIDFISEQISDAFSEKFMSQLIIMPCNGTKRYQWKDGEYVCVFDSDMVDEVGRVEYSDLLSRLLREQYKFMMDTHISLDCTGTFFDYRGSMLNWSPMGRNGNKETRRTFVKFDRENNYRFEVIEDLKKYTNSQRIKVEIKLGGDTSFDIFPVGWDKTFCLRHLDSSIEDIRFFGDRCFPGGNDYEISRVVKKSHQVSGPDETSRILRTILEK